MVASFKVMSSKPKLFVGSSAEGLEVARAVRGLVYEAAEIHLWNEGFFRFGQGFLETLSARVCEFDFAVLIATRDDDSTSRQERSFTPRDNVVFELGLFMGHLGRERVFLVHPRREELKIPSDLAGIMTASFDWPYNRAEEEKLPSLTDKYRLALGHVCDDIRAEIRRLGPKESKLATSLRVVQSDVDAARKETAELFALSMSDDAFHNLLKLRAGWDGHYYLDPGGRSGLVQELRHLKLLGYIALDKDPNVKGIGNLPTGNQSGLSRFVSVTTTGQRFIELREEAIKRLSR
jgi:predicted nucleotide-binding protein